MDTADEIKVSDKDTEILCSQPEKIPLHIQAECFKTLK